MDGWMDGWGTPTQTMPSHMGDTHPNHAKPYWGHPHTQAHTPHHHHHRPQTTDHRPQTTDHTHTSPYLHKTHTHGHTRAHTRTRAHTGARAHTQSQPPYK